MNQIVFFQRLITLALAVILIVPASAFSETRRLPQTKATAIGTREVLDAMNSEREQRGLGPLRLDARLNAAASDRIGDMFDKHYFDHVSPDGTQPFVWVNYRSYRYSTVGENLAEGYRSAAAVVNGWMNSPGHRRNLLGQSFQDTGIAIVRGSPTGRSNGFTVVALYAREAARNPSAITAGVSREGILDAMNRERERRGLPRLRLDARLNAAASDRIRDMFNKHYFDHVSPDGMQPFVWVNYRSYRYSTVGENLAEGYRSAAAVVNGWMNSPGHRRNLLGQSFQDAGIAIVRGSPSGRTNSFTVVALYAREAVRYPSAVMAP
jgi:uncharacterized protein YkwD